MAAVWDAFFPPLPTDARKVAAPEFQTPLSVVWNHIFVDTTVKNAFCSTRVWLDLITLRCVEPYR
jgi:hypothetical protein